MLRFGSTALLTLALLLAAAQANATSVVVLGYDLGTRIDFTRTVGGSTSNGSAQTAMLNILLDDGTKGSAFCVDLDHTIGTGTFDADIYAPDNAPGGETRDFAEAAKIANAWTHDVAAKPKGSVRDAFITAVQAAIWDVVYGDDLTVTGFRGNTAAETIFEQIMQAYSQGDYDSFDGTRVLDFERRQDQLITGDPVPEPTAGLLFGAGLLVVSQSRRFRSAARR